MPISVQDFIRQEAARQGVDPRLALAVAEQESGFDPTASNPTAVNGERAVGTFQFLPSTAKARGVNAEDPYENIRGGIGYLRELLDTHQGDLQAVLKAYGGVRRNTTYVPGVLVRVQKFQREAAPAAPVAPPSRDRLVAQPPPPLATEETARPVPLPELGGVGPKVIPSPKAFERPEGSGEWLVRQGVNVASMMDPRTREGARNLAGAAGAALATGAYVATAPVSVPATLAALGTAGVIGAMGGGAFGEIGSQVVGTAPPSTTAILGAGAEQGAYEAAGQFGLIWPARILGKRLIASRVGRFAHEALQKAQKATGEQLHRALESASSIASKYKVVGKAGEEALGPPTAPTAGEAGRAARELLQPGGAARTAYDRAGEAVRETAALGPDIDTPAIKTELERMAAERRPSFEHGEVPQIAVLAQGATAPGRTAAITAENLARLRALGLAIPEEHPLPGILAKIQTMPDRISYADAHKMKLLLDEAINWDVKAKKSLGQITKGIRGALREAMRGFKPYDEATAEFERIAPIYSKEYIQQFMRKAETDPDVLVRIINPKKPNPAWMLREALVTQSAEGGGGTAGQRAWDLVRGAWTHDKLLQGGLMGLSKRRNQLPREFVDNFYKGDETGRMVWENMGILSTAYDAVEAQYLRFARTTLSPEQVGADITRFFALGPTQVWGGLSGLRLALRGPKAADLLELVAYSPENTQSFVKFLLGASTGGQVTALAPADVLRLTGILDKLGLGPSSKPSSRVAQPPPGAQVATPPPS